MKVRMLLLVVLCALIADAQTKAQLEPAQLLARAREAMGFNHLQGKVIHTKWTTAVDHAFESDRMYPPFFSMMLSGESWTDTNNGIERIDAKMEYPGSVAPVRTIGNGSYNFMLPDNAAPVAQGSDEGRDLDAWLTISDWSKDDEVRYAGQQVVRDYPRDVLVRKSTNGEEKLYLDPKTAYPVMLEREEPHYLWGQQKIRYIYSVWQQFGDVFSPGSTFRMADDAVESSRTIFSFELADASAAPSMTMPDPPKEAVDPKPIFLRPYPPQTIDVSGNTKVLSNRGYREVITRVGDEVYVFDATQGEARARQDHDIIRKLYPGTKHVNVVVTDLAWPHVSGLRYWAANGATIITHRAAEPFLRRVLNRRWTLKPDLYERSRNSVKVKFVTVDRKTEFAGGKIVLEPIDGIGSEVALIAYIPADHFLWASDFVQDISQPTMYAKEVIAAVGRARFQPEKVAAEHLPLNKWQNVVVAQQSMPKHDDGQ